MSGIYSNWIKPQYPFMDNEITQMRSEGFQKPFYFGGSQVPDSLGIRGGAIVMNPSTGKIITPPNQGKVRQQTGFLPKSRIIKPRSI